MTAPLSSIPRFEEVRIENTNACGYHCVMCPREKQTRKLGYMSIGDFALIVQRLSNFEGSFHLHGFGEPLLDRHLAMKIAHAKKTYPKATTTIFSTLGVRAREALLEQLAASGLDFLIVSWYGLTKGAYQKIHQFDGFDIAKKNLEFLCRKIKEHGSSLQIDIKIPNQKIYSTLSIEEETEQNDFIQWAKDLGCTPKFWGYVHNYGNGRDYNRANEQKLCPVIQGRRRNILTITWDLDVIPCCYDYNATIRFGNLRHNSLEEIFTSSAYFNFVLKHKMHELNEFPVCQTCEKNDAE